MATIKAGDIGSKLKRVRENAGLTQKEIAGKMLVAIGTLSLWERGVTQPRLEKLAEFLGICGYKLVIVRENSEAYQCFKVLEEAEEGSIKDE